MTAQNSTAKIFYTYAHYRASAPELGPFYIGKGQGPRAWKTGGTGRNLYWRRVVAKHGLHVEILAKWDSEQDAHEHERLLIACFRHIGAGLVNMTDGGEGLSSPAPETRAKISARAKKQWSNPHERDALLAARNTPEARMRKSESIRRALGTAESMEKRSAAVRASHSRPEVRQKMQANAADQGYRARVSEGVRKALSTPEEKARKSQASKAMWEDESHRARFAALMRAKAEARWATMPPDKAAKLRRAADLDAARKLRNQKMSAPSTGDVA